MVGGAGEPIQFFYLGAIIGRIGDDSFFRTGPRPKIKKMTKFLELEAPAKINLLLAVTGKRGDGFHSLVSIITKLELSDTLRITPVGDPGYMELSCPGNPELENGQNLIIRAIRAWQEKSGQKIGFDLLLNKNIPLEAGLGGGSSDAVAALRGVNLLAGEPLNPSELHEIALGVGSDCPFFLHQGTCLVEGRGERVQGLQLPAKTPEEVFLFRPPLGHPTAKIYGILENRGIYSEEAEVHQKIRQWKEGEISLDEFVFNDLERAVFHKYLYFSPLFEELRAKYGLCPRISGSGSACFSFLPRGFNDEERLKQSITEYWGEEVWFCKTRVLPG